MINQTESANPFRAALTRKGWTIARGAAETGYSPSYFAMMVREPRLMSDRMARRLARVLGVDLAEAPPRHEGRAP